MPQEHILELLEEYYQSGYSIKDFCFLKEIDESTLLDWIQKYSPDRIVTDDDPFLSINLVKEDRKAGRQKKNQPAEGNTLFARIGDIELYHQVPAAYLKSLKS